MKYHILVWYYDVPEETGEIIGMGVEIYHEDARDAAIRHGKSTGCPFTVYLGEIVGESDDNSD